MVCFVFVWHFGSITIIDFGLVNMLYNGYDEGCEETNVFDEDDSAN